MRSSVEVSSSCKRQEVLVRLQVGVRLGEREQLPQRAGQHVLGLRLLLGPGSLACDRRVAGLRRPLRTSPSRGRRSP